MASKSSDVTVVVRPLKIVAEVCACLSLILMIVCVATAYWLDATGFHQGLWKYCHKPEGGEWNCDNTDKAWIKACGALSIIALLGVLAGVVLTGAGLFLKDIDLRYKLFMCSVIVLLSSVLLLVIALIVFPVMFMQDIEEYRNEFSFEKWYFAWSYGVAWGAGIFAAGAAMLLFVDRKNDDIVQKSYYQE